MVEGVLALLASAAAVFCRAIQQQNVVGGYYLAAFVTSYGIALCDVATVLLVVSGGMHMVPWVGSGGAIGVATAMVAHRRATRGRI